MSSYERQTLSRRPEYTLENMGRIFTVLEGFGINVTPQEQYEYDQLFCGIDFADQLTDNGGILPEAHNLILTFLIGKRDFLPREIPQPALENFSFLREIIAERSVGSQLEEIVGQLLSLHDQLCATISIKEYIKLTREEAVKSAEMVFLFVREELPPKVKYFLTQANILGNLADNLLDSESDFAEGKISLKPSKGLKLALKKGIARQIVFLCWNYPQKQELVGLAKKYLAMLSI